MDIHDENYYYKFFAILDNNTIGYAPFIIISSKEFLDGKNKKLRKRMKDIVTKCGFQIDVDADAKSDKKIYYIYYATSKDIPKNTDDIISLLRLEYKDKNDIKNKWTGTKSSYWIISDVCSIKDKSGFLKNLTLMKIKLTDFYNQVQLHTHKENILKYYSKIFPDYMLFFTTPYILNMDPNSVLITQLIRYYIFMGLGNARLARSEIAIGDVIILDSNYDKKKGINERIMDTKHILNEYYEKWEKKICVKIDNNILKFIKTKIAQGETEIGGIFKYKMKSYYGMNCYLIDGYDLVKTPFMLYDTKEEEQVAKCHVLATGTGLFKFHTHPEICAELLETTVSWPSSLDMKSTLLSALRGQLYYSLVFSKEKLYYYYINPIYINYLRVFTTTYKMYIVRYTFIYFMIMEHFRNEKLGINKNVLLQNLKNIDTLTLNDMKNEYDTKIDIIFKAFGVHINTKSELLKESNTLFKYIIKEDKTKLICNTPIFKFGYNEGEFKDMTVNDTLTFIKFADISSPYSSS